MLYPLGQNYAMIQSKYNWPIHTQSYELRWDWNGLCRIVLTFHNRGLYWITAGLSGLDEDCDRFVDLQSASQSKKSITIDKILTESIFLINVKMVWLGDFSGSVYANFPTCSEQMCQRWLLGIALRKCFSTIPTTAPPRSAHSCPKETYPIQYSLLPVDIFLTFFFPFDFTAWGVI